jgi:hypothetical protein
MGLSELESQLEFLPFPFHLSSPKANLHTGLANDALH